MDTLSEIGSGVGNGLKAIGNEAVALPGQIGNFFGGNPGAGAANGTPGAVAPAVAAPAGTGASGGPLGAGASAAASGGLPADLSQASAPPLAAELGLDHSGGALDAGITAAGASPIIGPTPAPTAHVTPLDTSAFPSHITPPHSAPNAAPFLKQAAGVALPFALNALMPQPGAAQLKQMKALETEQQSLAGEHAAAANAEQLGKLPQPAQALIDRQLQERIAQIKNQYAQAGMSGSSAENADIASAKQDALAQQFTVGNQLAATALGQVATENNLSNELLGNIYNSEVGQSEKLQELIMKMAGLVATGAVPATKAA